MKQSRSLQLTHMHWLLLGMLLVISGLVLSTHSNETAAKYRHPIDHTAATLPLSLPPNGQEGNLPVPAPTAVQQAVEEQWRTIKVKSGDSLSSIFARVGLNPQLLHTILSLGDEAESLKRIHPGEIIKLKLAEQSQLVELMYDIDPTRSLRIWGNHEGYQTTLIERPVERRISQVSGIITSSLFEAAQEAGMSDSLTIQLAGMFGWDIDFALDLRDGDSFTVVYDDLYVEGERLRHGDILAAEFVNRGRTYQAVRYTDASGRSDYYTPDGKSMRKAFLRTPVEFSRISSRFTNARFHPVLNRLRAHKGVDYAAPTGTPIKATGDGKVAFVGLKGGYGKVIELQHGSRYSTLYGHMSRFASGLRPGTRIRQGQTIGYVGMSGLATGPHLHYEFRIDGIHRNPLTVQFPDAAPIAPEYKKDFIAKTQALVNQIESKKSAVVATNDH